MNREPIRMIGLLALVLVAANARAETANFTLKQTAKPITRTYPGVHADVLGIRTGMTISQAEAIAKRISPEKTVGFAESLSVFFNGGELQTKPLVPYVEFGSKSGANTLDYLTLQFLSPATGSTVYYIKRKIQFNTRTNSSPYPPINAIKASLIKKYGPPSYQQNHGQYGRRLIAWIFDKTSRLVCKSSSCVGRQNGGGGLTSLDPQLPKKLYDKALPDACGTFAGSPAVFKIVALIDPTGPDKPTARAVKVSMWDAQACVNDADQVWEQFHAAVAKFSKR